jgi:site-specific recombinase XerD
VDKSQADIQVALAALVEAKALKASRTREWYRSNVGAFRDWLLTQGYATSLGGNYPELAQAYLAAEAARPHRLAYRRRRNPATGGHNRYAVQLPGRLSEHSLNSRIRCLRAFGRWLVRERWIASSPFEGLELAGAPRLRKKVLSEDEINRLFTLLNERTDIGSRDRAILWLFLDTGIRLSELSTLTLSSVNLTDQDDGP